MLLLRRMTSAPTRGLRNAGGARSLSRGLGRRGNPPPALLWVRVDLRHWCLIASIRSQCIVVILLCRLCTHICSRRLAMQRSLRRPNGELGLSGVDHSV